jgi:aspartate 1-decarboxylase
MRTFVAAKLHGLRVTDVRLDYTGSVSIDPALLDEVGIVPYERVLVANLSNGERWETYVLAAEHEREFVLQGGSARLGAVGDPCVVMTFASSVHFQGARVAMLNADNDVVVAFEYQ